MTTRSILYTLLLVALASLALASVAPASADVPAGTTTSPFALAVACGVIGVRGRKAMRWTLVAANGYAVDEARPSCLANDLPEDLAYEDEDGEDYLRRLLGEALAVDEDGDPVEAEQLFRLLDSMQWDLGVAGCPHSWDEGYFRNCTEARSLEKTGKDEWILHFVVDGELTLGGSGSDLYYEDEVKLTLNGNRLTVTTELGDYVVYEVE